MGAYVSFQNELTNVNVSPGPAGYQKELKHPQAPAPPARHFHWTLLRVVELTTYFMKLEAAQGPRESRGEVSTGVR